MKEQFGFIHIMLFLTTSSNQTKKLDHFSSHIYSTKYNIFKPSILPSPLLPLTPCVTLSFEPNKALGGIVAC